MQNIELVGLLKAQKTLSYDSDSVNGRQKPLSKARLHTPIRSDFHVDQKYGLAFNGVNVRFVDVDNVLVATPVEDLGLLD